MQVQVHKMGEILSCNNIRKRFYFIESSSELKALKERIIKQLSDFYDGKSWVADNIKKKVFSLSDLLL